MCTPCAGRAGGVREDDDASSDWEEASEDLDDAEHAGGGASPQRNISLGPDLVDLAAAASYARDACGPLVKARAALRPQPL